MSNKKSSPKKTNNKKRKGISRAAIFLIVGLVIIAIPFIIWGSILLGDSMQSGEPVLGERFTNDLEPAITEESIASIETSVEAKSSVEAVELTLKTATMRINVDVTDSMTKEKMLAMAEEIYAVVDNELSVATYFTSTSTKRMYDLEVHVYNSLEYIDTDNYIYVQLIKNAMMTEYETAVVSEPKDPDLVAEMLAEEDAVVEETTTPEGQEETTE